jgi:uncharacterized BrkB/YihY/UPF0761 family membrane protein
LALWDYQSFVAARVGIASFGGILAGMNWYWNVVDRLDTFWERFPPRPKTKGEKLQAPSVQLMAMHVAGLAISGFGMGCTAVIAIRAHVSHDSYGYVCGLIGVVGAGVSCFVNAAMVLLSYARACKSGLA